MAKEPNLKELQADALSLGLEIEDAAGKDKTKAQLTEEIASLAPAPSPEEKAAPAPVVEQPAAAEKISEPKPESKPAKGKDALINAVCTELSVSVKAISKNSAVFHRGEVQVSVNIHQSKEEVIATLQKMGL